MFSRLRAIFLFFGGFVQALDFRGWISDGLILEDVLRPGEIEIFVEVAAVENHEVDILAHIAFGNDAVGGGALRAVLDGFAELWFAEGFGLFGEHFFYMGEHALFERLFS